MMEKIACLSDLMDGGSMASEGIVGGDMVGEDIMVGNVIFMKNSNSDKHTYCWSI